jgi:mannose/fructose/N-acetylgalactosamine-specific phosphotransferase system component IID
MCYIYVERLSGLEWYFFYMPLIKKLYAFMENEKLRKSMVMIVFTPFNEI